jgi:plastocyanin/mono/diheme cytochrome c family protein
MNTSKQINAMIVLLLLLLLLVGIYTIWDPFRAEATAERTREELTERAAKLYANNCRQCHGSTGEGRIGPALNPEVRARANLLDYTDPAALEQNQQLVRYTLICGRIGTQMPPWALEHGGSLNDQQIENLVLLITNPPEGMWERLPEIEEELHLEAELPPIEEITANPVITGAASPVCGQRAPAPPAEETGPVEVRTQWEVIATDNRFNVNRMGIPAGQPVTVQFQNNGQALHNWHVLNVQSAQGQPVTTQLLTGGRGETITFTINQPGSYPYLCDVHPVEMRGTLVVQEGGGASGSGAAPAAAGGATASPAPSPSPSPSPSP